MPIFEWDEDKDLLNRAKHHVSFKQARKAFEDPKRIVYKDIDHSTQDESRYFCIGKVGQNVCAVRFTLRNGIIRIFGAGFWRKEAKLYEQKNKTRNR